MADYYTQFCFEIELPSDVIKWVIEEAQIYDNYDEIVDPDTEGGNYTPTGAEFTVEIERGVEVLVICASESGDPEVIVKILQDALKKFELDIAIGFGWANTCSKMRVGDFGGGAVVFDKHSEKWIDTEFFINDTKNAWNTDDGVVETTRDGIVKDPA
ncbi:MAG: hypothetical protein WCJ64_06665 [Rhodospirillaceae bacterium]